MTFFPLLKKRIITGLIPVLFPLAAYAECLPDGIYKISHVTCGNTATIFTDISEEEGSQYFKLKHRDGKQIFSAGSVTSEIRPASETQSEQVAGMQRTLFATPEDAVERCAVRIAGQDEDILLVQLNIQNLTKSEVMKSGLFEQVFSSAKTVGNVRTIANTRYFIYYRFVVPGATGGILLVPLKKIK